MAKSKVIMPTLFIFSLCLLLSTFFISLPDLKNGNSTFFTRILDWEFFFTILLFYFLKNYNFAKIIGRLFWLLIFFIFEAILVSRFYAENLLRFLFIAFMAAGIKWVLDRSKRK